MVSSGKSLSELSCEVVLLPQLTTSISVKNKEAALNNRAVKGEIKKVEKELENVGRIMVRASGTEPKIRIMIEAEAKELCAELTDRIVSKIKSEGLTNE